MERSLKKRPPTRSSHLRLFIVLLYGHYSWLARGLISLEDGSKAPRIAANKTRLMDQLRQTRAQLRANLRFLERIGYIHSLNETRYHVHATLRLPTWICTMDTNVLSVVKLDLIHADASLLKLLPPVRKSRKSSTKPTSTTFTGKNCGKRRREHYGSLPTFNENKE
jgi:hypothetical protein